MTVRLSTNNQSPEMTRLSILRVLFVAFTFFGVSVFFVFISSDLEASMTLKVAVAMAAIKLKLKQRHEPKGPRSLVADAEGGSFRMLRSWYLNITLRRWINKGFVGERISIVPLHGF